MKTKILFPLAAIIAVALLHSHAALAGPMLCSGEQKTCIASCGKTGPDLSICVTNCAQRKAVCVKTGCWDNGAQRYCGLTRQ